MAKSAKLNYDNIKLDLSRIRNKSFPSQPKSRNEIVTNQLSNN